MPGVLQEALWEQRLGRRRYAGQVRDWTQGAASQECQGSPAKDQRLGRGKGEVSPPGFSTALRTSWFRRLASRTVRQQGFPCLWNFVTAALERRQKPRLCFPDATQISNGRHELSPPQNTLPIVWLSIHTKNVHVCTCVGSAASTVSASLQTHGLQPARFLCPWASPGENTGVGCHALLQGIFPTHGSNPGPLAVQADSLSSELPGKPQETWGEFQGRF